MRKIGYARVSSVNQRLDRQLGALRAEECTWIYEEKVSGKSLKIVPSSSGPLGHSGPATSW